MNICLLTRYFSLSNTGVGRVAMEIKHGLADRGHNVIGIQTKGAHTTLSYFYYAVADLFFRLPGKYDVYHALSPVESLYLPKKRAVVTIHDFIPILYLDQIKTHYLSATFEGISRIAVKNFFKLASICAAECRYVVCTNESVKDDLLSMFNIGLERVKVIRLGIRNYIPDQVEHDTVRFGTLSYLDERKRVHLLIEAFMKVPNKNYELIIGGMGEQYNNLRNLAAGDSRIKFTGFVPEESMNAFYNDLDYFVFPTKVEGYGLPIIEAMACKKPVVVLRDAILPKEIKSRCIVADDLAGFIEQPFHISLIEESNYKFARLHDWNTCVDQYISLYEGIANENR